MSERVWPTRDGRFGIRQLYRGLPTGGGTVNLGWASKAEALDANPPLGDHTYEVFERWSGGQKARRR